MQPTEDLTMNIAARFASSCPCCRQPIQVGSTVEWSKGSPARHTACVGAAARVPDLSAPRTQYRRGACPNPRDCGDPTCTGNCGY